MNRLSAGISDKAMSAGILRATKQGLVWLLRATFSQDMAAPLPTSLPIDVGGPLTVTDTESKLSISGGALQVAGGKAVPVWGNPAVAESSTRIRAAGQAAFFTVTPTAISGSGVVFGWTNATAPTTNISGFRMQSTTLMQTFVLGATVATLAPLVNGVEERFGVISRSIGAFYVRWEGGRWVLQWVDNVTAYGPQRVAVSNNSAALTIDEIKALELATFATDAQVYTNRLASPAAGATTTSTADAVLEYTVMTLPTAGNIQVDIRKQDASNHWYVWVNSAGSLYLYENVAGVITLRASVGTIVAAGHRIVVVQEAAVIKIYSNNILRITYSSATNFQTAITVGMNSFGTGGGVSELICWRRYPTLPGGI